MAGSLNPTQSSVEVLINALVARVEAEDITYRAIAKELGFATSTLTRFVKRERVSLELNTFNSLGAYLNLWIVPSGDNFFYERGVSTTIDHFLDPSPNNANLYLKNGQRTPPDVHMHEFMLVLLSNLAKMARKNSLISDRDLAKRLKTTHWTLYRFQQGKSLLSLSVISSIFDVVGLRLTPAIFDGWSVANEDDFRSVVWDPIVHPGNASLEVDSNPTIDYWTIAAIDDFWILATIHLSDVGSARRAAVRPIESYARRVAA